MLLNYTSNKNIVIEAHESCRVPVPVERCSLFDAKEEKPPEDCKTHESIETSTNKSFVSSLVSDQYIYKDENNKNQRICSDHISKLVKLNWSLLGSDIKGTASLKGITLSSAMLGLISVPPLKWGKKHAISTLVMSLIESFLCRNFHQRCSYSVSIGHHMFSRTKYSNASRNLQSITKRIERFGFDHSILSRLSERNDEISTRDTSNNIGTK